MAFCGKCGQQVNEGVRFCPACGSPMQIVAAEPNRQQTPPPVQPTDAESMAKANAPGAGPGRSIGYRHGRCLERQIKWYEQDRGPDRPVR